MLEFLNLSSPIREEDEELLTRFSDFDPVKEWLVDLDPVAMMSLEPSDQGGEVVGSPIDAKMEKVRLVEVEERIWSDGPTGEEKIDSALMVTETSIKKEECGVGIGDEEKNGMTEMVGVIFVENGDVGGGNGVKTDWTMVEEEERIGSDGPTGEEKIDAVQMVTETSIKKEDGCIGGEEKNGTTEMVGAIFVEEGDDGGGDREESDLIGEEKNDLTMMESEEEDDSDDEEEESSDESSSSSSSSSSEEEEEEEGEIRDNGGEETVFVSDDEEDGSNSKGPVKSKYEMEDLPPVPPVEVSLESHHQTMPVGQISSILGSRVIVEGSEKHSALNEASILWITESRTPLGIVDEIFGPVKCPYYVIRYNCDEEVPTGISVGAAVSFVPEFAQHILNQEELRKKGYDASGDNDEELSEVEFSDDEKEAEYKRSLQQQKRGTTHVSHDSGSKRRTSFKGSRFQKDNRPPNFTPPVSAAMSQQHLSQAEQLQVQATNIGQNSRNFAQGAATVGPSVAPSTMTMQTIPPQPQGGAGTGLFVPFQQRNAVWANSLQPQPPSLGIQRGGYPMNPLQLQQFGQYDYNLQYQMQVNQAVNSFSGGMMPYMQQQFVPHLGSPHGNMPFFGALANPLAGQPLPLRPMGQAAFGQVSFDRSNVNPQGASGSGTGQSQGQSLPSVGQGEMRSPPMQSNHGRSSFRGRRPHQRGRHS